MKTDMPLSPLPRFPVAHALHAIPPALKGGVVAIGNFDGVHRGHGAILDEANRIAENARTKAVVLTFTPHPRTFFQPEKPVAILTSLAVKLHLLAAHGIEGAAVIPFNETLAGMSAEQFVEKVLIQAMEVQHVVVGYDFHFGKNRRGSTDFLREKGKEHGFSVTVVQPQGGNAPYSSSAARQFLHQGDIDAANAVLGYRWFVQGEVVHGEKRGRELGFPTANIALPDAVPLRHGIYAVQARVNTTCYEGIASFGRRPMFDNGAPLLEVYLFDASPDLYGQQMQVEFVAFIRDELRFDSIDALIARMQVDCEEARVALQKTKTTVTPKGIADT